MYNRCVYHKRRKPFPLRHQLLLFSSLQRFFRVSFSSYTCAHTLILIIVDTHTRFNPFNSSLFQSAAYDVRYSDPADMVKSLFHRNLISSACIHSMRKKKTLNEIPSEMWTRMRMEEVVICVYENPIDLLILVLNVCCYRYLYFLTVFCSTFDAVSCLWQVHAMTKQKQRKTTEQKNIELRLDSKPNRRLVCRIARYLCH